VLELELVDELIDEYELLELDEVELVELLLVLDELL